MFPTSSASSVRNKIRRHRLREDDFDDSMARELETNANFARKIRKKAVTPSIAELLLGDEFDSDFGNSSSPLPFPQVSCTKETQDISNDVSPAVKLTHLEEANKAIGSRHVLPSNIRRDWTVQPISRNVMSSLAAIRTITVRVHAAHGGTRLIKLSSDCLARLRGTEPDDAQKSWVDDQTIDGFGYLINERSRTFMGLPAPHRPSKDIDIFTRKRVRAYVFPTHFFTCWNGSTNGGYARVSKWRRKVPEYNSIGMSFIPACINDSHLVLAVVDADGRQFIYYDPYGGSDGGDVIRCAKEWISGEVRTARRGDVFKGLQISKWFVKCNPGCLPKQTDLSSCGIFTMFVAEHFERG